MAPNNIPPDYILARPRLRAPPATLGSCDKEDLDELRKIREKGEYIYKLVGRKPE